MVWRSRGGPDMSEVQQPRIDECTDRRQVAKRRDTANGEPGLPPHQRGIGLAQWLARQSSGFRRIDSVSAGGQEQDRLAAGLSAKNDGLGDLVDVAAHRLRRIGGSAGKGRFANVGGFGSRFKGGAHAFKALAHGGIGSGLRFQVERAVMSGWMASITMNDNPPATRDLLLELETAVWQALRDGDAAADRAALAADFLGVYPTGQATRADHVSQLNDGASIATFELSLVTWRDYGNGLALISYRARYRRVGRGGAEHMFVSSLWRAESGQWRNVFSQDTPCA